MNRLKMWYQRWFGVEPITPTEQGEDHWPVFTTNPHTTRDVRWPEPGFQDILTDLPVDEKRKAGSSIERHGIKYRVVRVIGESSVEAIAVEIGTGNDATGVSW